MNPLLRSSLAFLITLVLMFGCAGGNAAEEPTTIPAASSASGAATGWVQWTKLSVPVFKGQYSIASDPSVLRDGDVYRMFHTGLDVKKTRTIICQATSKDGLSWKYVSVKGPHNGMILQGRDGKWDENLEGPCIVKKGREYLLFFSGYRDKGHPMKGFPAALFLARSSDGQTFTRVPSNPVLKPTPGWYDNDAVYSPTIIQYKNQYVMIYVGHCYTKYDKIKYPGVYLLAATSANGYTWKKRQIPVLGPGSKLAWMREGGAEPNLVAGPDGKFYLFFTGLAGEKRVIGVARSDSPYGPWDINPNPIVTPTPNRFDEHQVLAPHVLIENNEVHMWYLGVNKKSQMVTGRAQAPWPIYQPPSKPAG